MLATYANAGLQDRDYSERLRYRNAVVGGGLLMGMTADEVKRSIGKPLKINRSVGSYGTHEQWVCGNINVYVDNGEVTGWN